MEDIEDDRSEVLAAAEVHRGGLQPLAPGWHRPGVLDTRGRHDFSRFDPSPREALL